MARRMKERAMAGPAPGRPKEAEWGVRYSRTGALRMDLAWSCWPAMAVPTIVKMPEPMTAPMPREVRLSQPRDFLSLISAPSQSEMSWSMSLQRNNGEATRALRECEVDAGETLS